jgi:hypothetical protein
MIQDVIAVAKKHYPEPITIPIVAQERGCTTHSLGKNIKSLTKKNHKYPIKIEWKKDNIPRGRFYITYVPR